jgi:hypothetical protein
MMKLNSLLALAIVAFAAPSWATAATMNGKSFNGVAINGIAINGVMNGPDADGAKPNAGIKMGAAGAIMALRGVRLTLPDGAEYTFR